MPSALLTISNQLAIIPYIVCIDFLKSFGGISTSNPKDNYKQDWLSHVYSGRL